MKTELKTAPSLQAISVDQAKSQTNTEHDEDDVQFSGWIDAATAYAEHYTGTKLLTQTWTVYADSFVDVELPFTPIQSVVVNYNDTAGDSQTLDPAGYYLDSKSYPARIVFLDFPGTDVGFNNVMIDVVCGYTAANLVPPAITAALLMHVATLSENREDIIVGTIVASVPTGVTSHLDAEKVSYL